MAKPRKGPRYPNGRLEHSRLWDRDGVEWGWTGEEVERPGVEQLLRADVPVALSMGAGPLRWCDGRAAKSALWRHEVAPNFYDEPGWRPPPGAPGQLPFHALLWRRGNETLLMFTDYD